MANEFRIIVDTGNAAFDPDAGPELARILRVVAERVQAIGCDDVDQPIYDVNGNKVGFFRYLAPDRD